MKKIIALVLAMACVLVLMAGCVSPAAPTTNAPTTNKAEESKGCGGFVAGSVAIVAIFGTALIVKKRD